MSRRRNRRYVVPQAEQQLSEFKAEVMRQQGYTVSDDNPEDVKYEVAESLGIPLTKGDNGSLSTEDAGRIGGAIGGSMVRELIRRAKEKLLR